VVRWKSAGTEPLALSTSPKQLAEDGEAGVGRQWALSPCIIVMMMMMSQKVTNCSQFHNTWKV